MDILGKHPKVLWKMEKCAAAKKYNEEGTLTSHGSADH